ncbi:MAG TPA: DUF935 family protein [Flavobacteriales bacterium]|nr:DUF935 family protein [Flavobacteriales bacterium]HMR28547.1 DUF935 family protein [Flavobacteriales bacterium]
MSQNARIGRQYSITSQLTVARISLRAHDVGDWQQAVNSARNELLPRRKALYELYDNLVLDAHLAAVMAKRTMNVTNKRLVWQQEGAGDALLHAINTDVLRTPWFMHFVEGSMSVVSHGSTVLELRPEAGRVAACDILPRANVVPEFGYIAADAAAIQTPWIHYRTDPYYSTYLVEVGRPRDLGALVIALPYVLWKRGSLGDWAQYAELFGMPFRVGQYDPWDEATRTKLNTALSEMGGAGYAVIPKGTTVEFHTPSTGGSNQGALYKDLVELCNAEISKLFLGQTMTTDQGSSRSQGEVHKEVEQDITLADMRRVEFLLNWELRPRLIKLGYPLQGGEFQFDQTRNLPLETRIDLDIKVAQQLGGQVPDRYWYDTYGVPMPGKGDTVKGRAPGDEPDTPPDAPPATKPEPEPEDEDPEPAPTNSMLAALDRLYAGTHHHAPQAAARSGPPEHITERLIKAIRAGQLTEDAIDPELMRWTADQLLQATVLEVRDQQAPDRAQLERWLDHNVYVFSALKTHHQLKAASDELHDDKGQVRPFTQFKESFKAINDRFNVRHLRAEYQHAVASTQMAERWLDIQRDKEVLPNLRFDTAGDDRVRPAHALLDGIVRPVDDPFWDTHYPPLAWGCRCDVNQTAEDVSGELPEGLARVPAMFRGNVGKTGIIFPESHPYYQVSARTLEAAKAAAEAMNKRAAPAATRPIGTPVSAGMDLRRLKPAEREKAMHVLKLADQVHGLPGNHGVPIMPWRDGVQWGRYSNTLDRDLGIAIFVDWKDPHALVHMAHELGHHIDKVASMGGTPASSYDNSVLAPAMKAILRSPTVQRIQQVYDSQYNRTGPVIKGLDGQWHPLIQPELNAMEYWLRKVELWARAYNQYIALRSRDEELQRLTFGWSERRRIHTLTCQWPQNEFLPIARAIDTCFNNLQWLTTAR